jgi:hypothetical protein
MAVKILARRPAGFSIEAIKRLFMRRMPDLGYQNGQCHDFEDIRHPECAEQQPPVQAALRPQRRLGELKKAVLGSRT